MLCDQTLAKFKKANIIVFVSIYVIFNLSRFQTSTELSGVLVMLLDII